MADHLPRDSQPEGRAEPLEDKLLDWLAKSGHALELRTARAFSSSRWKPRIRTGFIYTDVIEHKAREGDVDVLYTFHNRHHLPWRLQLSVECKSESSKPWVIFPNLDNHRWEGQPLDLKRWLALDEPDLADFGLQDGLPLGYGWTGKAPFNSHGGSHIASALDGSNNRASDAVRQAVSAALAASVTATTVEPQGKALDDYLSLAVVVTSAPLFECTIDNQNAIAVTSIKYGDVPDPGGRPCRVLVVHESYLAQLITDIDGLVQTACENW